ncbi:phage major capsid protein [Jeotgalibaca porci]|uniref:phage major capsid protein n=1 Tax=Jeotgalibaca porci TaxID=1868793 RepID=UPI0035A0ACB1
MTIKFGKSEGLKAAQENWKNIAMKEGSTQEEQTNALQAYMEALQDSVASAVRNQVNDEMLDRSILQQRGQNVLTSKETKFFNAVVEQGGFTDDAILPETTQERIFEDITNEHPLLEAIGLEDLGALTRYIYTDDVTGAAVWGPLFGGIAGQINATFKEKQIGQNKLTAFAVIPNDMLELGPVWVERYVRALIVEVVAAGLENGFVNGTGANGQPIGLMKNVDPDTSAVTEKVAEALTLTFAPSQYGEVVAGELYEVVKALSTNADGKTRKVLNKIVMVVNPVDAIAVQARNTIQTANGQWVMSLPYNIQVEESEEVAVGKALFFVKGEYIAVTAGGYKLKKFDQTMAIEDATLYTVKQFANGMPKDNKTALLYNLDIKFTPAVPEV